MKETYVIGGGIAGLIWTFFHPESTLIAGDDFIKKRKRWDVPLPRYIYDKEICRIFVEEVTGRSWVTNQIRVGIYHKNKYLKENNDALRLQYYEKTRGVSGSYPSHAMSGGKMQFDVIDYTFEELERCLAEYIKKSIIKSDLLVVDPACRFFVSGDSPREKSYDELVITMPQPAFWRVTQTRSRIAREFVYNPIYIHRAETTSDFIWSNDFDYILYPEKEIPFYRLTKGEYPNVGIETITPFIHPEIKFNVYPFDFRICESHISSFGKIINMSDVARKAMNYPGIRFFGRYGAWDPSIKVHDLLMQIYKEQIEEKKKR